MSYGRRHNRIFQLGVEGGFEGLDGFSAVVACVFVNIDQVYRLIVNPAVAII